MLLRKSDLQRHKNLLLDNKCVRRVPIGKTISSGSSCIMYCRVIFDELPVDELTTCKNCSPGTWSDLTRRVECKVSHGQVVERQAQTSESTCKNCLPGMWSDMIGVSECKECARGKWSSMAGVLSARSARGKWSKEKAQTSESTCKECARQVVEEPEAQTSEAHARGGNGTWSDMTGVSGCKECAGASGRKTKHKSRKAHARSVPGASGLT